MNYLEDFLNLTNEEQTVLFYEIGIHIDTVKIIDVTADTYKCWT